MLTSEYSTGLGRLTRYLPTYLLQCQPSPTNTRRVNFDMRPWTSYYLRLKFARAEVNGATSNVKGPRTCRVVPEHVAARQAAWPPCSSGDNPWSIHPRAYQRPSWPLRVDLASGPCTSSCLPLSPFGTSVPHPQGPKLLHLMQILSSVHGSPRRPPYRGLVLAPCPTLPLLRCSLLQQGPPHCLVAASPLLVHRPVACRVDELSIAHGR